MTCDLSIFDYPDRKTFKSKEEREIIYYDNSVLEYDRVNMKYKPVVEGLYESYKNQEGLNEYMLDPIIEAMRKIDMNHFSVPSTKKAKKKMSKIKKQWKN